MQQDQKSTKYDISKPYTAKPAAAMPDIAKLDTAKPDIAKPNTAKPDMYCTMFCNNQSSIFLIESYQI